MNVCNEQERAPGRPVQPCLMLVVMPRANPRVEHLKPPFVSDEEKEAPPL